MPAGSPGMGSKSVGVKMHFGIEKSLMCSEETGLVHSSGKCQTCICPSQLGATELGVNVLHAATAVQERSIGEVSGVIQQQPSDFKTSSAVVLKCISVPVLY